MFGIRGSKHNGVLIFRIAWLIIVLGYWLYWAVAHFYGGRAWSTAVAFSFIVDFGGPSRGLFLLFSTVSPSWFLFLMSCSLLDRAQRSSKTSFQHLRAEARRACPSWARKKSTEHMPRRQVDAHARLCGGGVVWCNLRAQLHREGRCPEDLPSAMVWPYFGYLSPKCVFEATEHGCANLFTGLGFSVFPRAGYCCDSLRGRGNG